MLLCLFIIYIHIYRLHEQKHNRLEGLNSKHLFLTVLEAERSKALADSVSGIRCSEIRAI